MEHLAVTFLLDRQHIPGSTFVSGIPATFFTRLHRFSRGKVTDVEIVATILLHTLQLISFNNFGCLTNLGSRILSELRPATNCRCSCLVFTLSNPSHGTLHAVFPYSVCWPLLEITPPSAWAGMGPEFIFAYSTRVTNHFWLWFSLAVPQQFLGSSWTYQRQLERVRPAASEHSVVIRYS